MTTTQEKVQFTEDEVLTAFAEVMQQWGHYKTARGLRWPTREEASAAFARSASRYDGEQEYTVTK